MYTLVYIAEDKTFIRLNHNFNTREDAQEFLNECPDYLCRGVFVLEIV